jgi:RNA polymerase sigma-70 factor (ECF subfamily)
VTCQQLSENSDAALAQGFQCEVVALSNVLLLRAIRLTPNRADAEDLVQETLLYAFKGFDKFEPGTNAKAWLYRIMRNRWVNGYRRSEVRPVEDLQGSMTDSVLSGAIAPIWAEHRSAEDKVLSRVPDPALQAALATLSPALREVLYYKFVEGYTYQEIAALVNVPVGTVMSRIHRGRRRIRDQLSALCAAASPC